MSQKNIRRFHRRVFIALIPLGLVALGLFSGCPKSQTQTGTAEGPTAFKADLPAPLEKYRGTIASSVRSFIRIKAQAGATRPWESKFAGDPYFPRDAAYPLDRNKKPMKLLAQINFEELPDGALFPKKGIVEFFITAQSDALGLDFDNPLNQADFRIIFFEDPTRDASRLRRDFSSLKIETDEYFPIPKEAKLSFATAEEPVSYADFQFQKYFQTDFYTFFTQFGDDQEDLMESYSERFSGAGHKLGGYAFFTQTDPRETRLSDYDVLLLQIDADDGLGIMWGDGGVANFFIKKSDLEKRDFSKVLYNWDCY